MYHISGEAGYLVHLLFILLFISRWWVLYFHTVVFLFRSLRQSSADFCLQVHKLCTIFYFYIVVSIKYLQLDFVQIFISVLRLWLMMFMNLKLIILTMKLWFICLFLTSSSCSKTTIFFLSRSCRIYHPLFYNVPW